MTIFAESGIGTRRHAATATERRARIRHYVMTPPQFFAVDYAINPWMDTTNPVDTTAAVAQWQHLHDIYLQLGHTVDLVDPVPGPARHGLRRQRWIDTRRHGCCRALQIRSAPTGVSRLRRMAESLMVTSRVHTRARQRRPGRSAAGGRDDLGRNGFPNRPAGARRDRRDLRAVGSSASNWSIRASTISIPR